MGQRVYGEKISINTERVKDFYNKRAAMVEEKGWEAVSLGSENPEIAARIYNYDQNELFPKLGIDGETRVLEVGCGMGRWANIILPHCREYYGIDFSEGILNAAKKICHDYADRGHFYHMSASEAVEKDTAFWGGGFGSILFSGVCMYINDDKLKQVFEKVCQLCDKKCTICIRETAAFVDRLTLNEFPSEALKSTYNAIYRTQQEYNNLFEPFFKASFVIAEQDFLPDYLGRKREDTNSWCTILRRA